MGGKAKKDDKMYKLQMQQAEEARKKEEERKARIDQGIKGIKEAFEGAPVMATREVAVPETVKMVAAPNSGGRINRSMTPNTGGGVVGGQHWATTQTPGQAQKGQLRRVVVPATTRTETYDTGQRTGGFDDSFYNKFSQGILDYYMPQVAQKYGEAKDQTTFGLARAGSLNSSAAIEEAAKLAEQNRLNRADVQAQADTGAADLRTRVASEKAKAESQLYATEDPDVATNQALAAVRNISLDQPDLTPLGEIFKIATIGGANTLGGYRNAQQIQQVRNALGGGNSKIYGA